MSNCLKRYIKIVAITLLIIIILLTILIFYICYTSIQYGNGHRTAHIISDIKQIQTALELFHRETGNYPDKLQFGGTLKFNEIVFMEIIPNYRLPGIGGCPKNYQYKYTSIKNGESYKLVYCLGLKAGGIEKGFHFASPENINNP